MKKIYYFFGLIGILLVPLAASAHVKWFVDADTVTASEHAITPFYTWTSTEVALWSVIVFVVVVLFGILDKKVVGLRWLVSFGSLHEEWVNRTAQILLGLFLVSVGILWKVLIIPDVPVVDGITKVLLGVQLAIGGAFIFNIQPKIAAAALMLFCGGLIFSNGIVTFLENALLFSLALYFFIVYSDKDSAIAWLKDHAVEIVRIGTGISLITLAFTEKLLFPELGLQFLEVHQWNFMQAIFPWFTNELFVLSVGFAEMIFGILFVLGYITRITTVLIALFFATSVTVMLVQFGQWEVEDLVVYAAAVILLVYGHGKTKFFHMPWATALSTKKYI